MALIQKASLINKVLTAYKNSPGIIRNYGLHFDPKFRKLRRKKMEAFRVKQLGNTEEGRTESLRLKGICPSHSLKDIPFYLGSTYTIMDPYVPPHGDGSYSKLKKLTQTSVDASVKGSKNYFHRSKLRKYDPSFDSKLFAHEAKEIYINAHKALASFNLDNLEKYATENALNMMVKNCENQTIKWDYLESLDIPTTVQIRVQGLSDNKNLFAQVTVRFHSKQMLAIYDRFGRLMYGSEILAKDVLEYVVFEKHITNVYGSWKLHDKIIPDWLPKKDPIPKTYREIPEKSEDEIIEEEYMHKRLMEGTKVKDPDPS